MQQALALVFVQRLRSKKEQANKTLGLAAYASMHALR